MFSKVHVDFYLLFNSMPNVGSTFKSPPLPRNLLSTAFPAYLPLQQSGLISFSEGNSLHTSQCPPHSVIGNGTDQG